MVLIFVIICIYNWDNYLGVVIDSLLVQDFFGNFEVLVVDNVLKDNICKVVEVRFMNFKLEYIYELVIGLFVVRNMGVKIVSVEILVYFDDDVVVSF